MDSIRLCSVAACSSKADARGLCSSHYARLKRYGDPLGQPVKAAKVCAVDDCSRGAISWGYCNMHAQRYYKHGDPLTTTPRTRNPCSVEDCFELAKGRGYCNKHLKRVRNHGSPLVVLAGGRPTDGLHPGWAAIHKRVSRLRGKASGYPCVDCGGAASEWSYDNKDPDHLVDPRLKIAYSLSTNHYVPRCIPCHRAFDANHRNSLTKERLT